MFYKYNKHREKEGGSRKTTVKLSTTINNIERDVVNSENKQLLVQFFEFMKRIGTSERYQNNNRKAIIAYSQFLEPAISFFEIKKPNNFILGYKNKK
jgi:hypothetical protein